MRPAPHGSARHLHLPGCHVDLVTREVRRTVAARADGGGEAGADGAGGVETARLTLQEARLLARLAATPDEAVSRQALLVEVWDYHPDSRSRAPDIAIRRLRTKLERDPSEPVHLCTVLGQGWVLRGVVADGRPERAPDPELVGRDGLVDAVDEALLADPGVCLVGPPGVGKTALARHVVGGLSGEVVPVPLEGVGDEGALLAAVAAALRLPVGGVADLGAHVGAVLADRPVLLWLDAPEAVAVPVARWLRTWSARCLVTSRLAVDGLPVVAVPPLPPSDAEALFRRLAPDVGLASDEVRRLVEGLDGLPLAIRLAAARARELGAQALLGVDGIRYERVAAPEAPGLERSIARSWALLDPVERDAMVALAPLVDGFDLAAAEAVTEPGERWVGDVLVDLVRRSLLVREPGPRYRMLRSVRWFAARQGEPPVDRLIDWALSGGGGVAALRRIVALAEARRPERLTELVLAVDDTLREALPLSERLALLQRGSGLEVRYRRARLAFRLGERGALDRLAALGDEAAGTPLADRVLVDLSGARRAARVPSADDVDALRLALDRTADPELRVRLLWELAEQHADRRAFREARIALQQAMVVDRDGTRRAELLCAVGHVALKQGRPDEGLAAVEEAVDLVSDGVIGERAWRTLGGLRYLSGDLDGAAAAWEQARDLARELGLWRQHVVSVGNLGLVHLDLGDDAGARRLFEEGLARSRELGQVQTMLPNLLNLGRVALLAGELAEARELLERAVALAGAHGWTEGVLEGRLGLAIAAQLEGGDAREALAELLPEARAAGARREAAVAAAHLALHGPPEGPEGRDRLLPSEARLLEAARRALSG